MARPVAILKTRPLPIEVQIARLGISKKRQKRLRQIIDAAWARIESGRTAQGSDAHEVRDKHAHASAAD
jgi:hypothetical protein